MIFLKIFVRWTTVLSADEILQFDILKNHNCKELSSVPQSQQGMSSLLQSVKNIPHCFQISVASCKQHCPVQGQSQSQRMSRRLPAVVSPWWFRLSCALMNPDSSAKNCQVGCGRSISCDGIPCCVY